VVALAAAVTGPVAALWWGLGRRRAFGTVAEQAAYMVGTLFLPETKDTRIWDELESARHVGARPGDGTSSEPEAAAVARAERVAEPEPDVVAEREPGAERVAEPEPDVVAEREPGAERVAEPEPDVVAGAEASVAEPEAERSDGSEGAPPVGGKLAPGATQVPPVSKQSARPSGGPSPGPPRRVAGLRNRPCGGVARWDDALREPLGRATHLQ
jgi:hypothetical protein